MARAVSRSLGDRAQALAIGDFAAQLGDDRDGQEQLAADEERHREEVQPAHRVPHEPEATLRRP